MVDVNQNLLGAKYQNEKPFHNSTLQNFNIILQPPENDSSNNDTVIGNVNNAGTGTPTKRRSRSMSSVLSPVAEGMQRKVSSIDQMAQFSSYYDVKGLGSLDDSEMFMEEVERKKSVVGTLLLPMMVTSGFANTASRVTDRIIRSISVGNPESQLIPEYKLENTVLPSCMLLHFGRLRLIWDWTILLLVAYLAIILPFNVAFKAHLDLRAFFIADFCLEFIFITDILLNFRTTYINPETGRLVTKPKSIAKNYLQHWFALDLIAALPFDIIYFANNDLANAVAVLKLIRLLRLFRIGRRVSRSIEYTATLLVLMMFSFALLSHWLACIWYVIGSEELNNGVDTGWLIKLGHEINKPYQKNDTHSVGGPTYSEEYISALYFIFTSLTTVGFGNISPNTVAEKTFSVIVLLLGAMVQSAIFGNMTAVIQKLYASRARFHAKASQIKQFVRHHQIDGELRKRIEDFFISHWSVSKGVNTEEMLESFPCELQADICLHLYRRFLTLPCFAHASRGCLRSISSKVRKGNFSPGELIIKEKDAINTLFFVQRGTVEIVQKDFIVAILGTGDLFGENVCKSSSGNGRSNGDVKALMYCEILYLSRDSIKDVVRFYPDFAELFSQSVQLSFDLAGNAVKHFTNHPSLPQPGPVVDSKAPEKVKLLHRLHQEIIIEVQKKHSSHELGSIVEESENQTSHMSSKSSSNENSDEEVSENKNRQSATSRSANNSSSSLPLWQIRSMQNNHQIHNSPSPSLRKRLEKMEETNSSCSDDLDIEVAARIDARSPDDHSDSDDDSLDNNNDKDFAYNDGIDVGNVDTRCYTQSYASPPSPVEVYVDNDFLDEQPPNKMRQSRSEKWTPTSFRRNRYQLTYFSSTRFPLADEQQDNKFNKVSTKDRKISEDSSLIEDTNMVNLKKKNRYIERMSRHSSSSLPPEEIHHTQNIPYKKSNLRMRKKQSLQTDRRFQQPNNSRVVKNENPKIARVDKSHDNYAYYRDENEAQPLSELPVSNEITHIDVPTANFPDIVVNTSYEGSHNTSFEHLPSSSNKNSNFLDSHYNDPNNDIDQGIFSQCSEEISADNENSTLNSVPQSASKENLQNWLKHVNKLTSNNLVAVHSRNGEKYEIDFDFCEGTEGGEHLHTMKDEISTLRNEMKELKTGMLALTELVRLSVHRDSKRTNEETKV